MRRPRCGKNREVPAAGLPHHRGEQEMLQGLHPGSGSGHETELPADGLCFHGTEARVKRLPGDPPAQAREFDQIDA